MLMVLLELPTQVVAVVALVKALVELHGGWVALESEPGSGAAFTCHLPERAEGAAGHPELEF